MSTPTQKMKESFKDVGEAGVNRKIDDKEKLALHEAARKNDLPEIKRLLSVGADVNARDNLNQTPLLVAAVSNRGDSHFDTMEMLLKSGADVNAQSQSGVTPLSYLISLKGCNVKNVKLLLNFGADVNKADSQGKTPLLKGITNGYEDLEVYNLLLDNGLIIDKADYYGVTPLCIASASGKIKLVKFLVKNGANVNCTINAPLIVYLINKRQSHGCVEFFLEYSDNVNVFDIKGKNVLNVVEFKYYESDWKIILKHIAKLQALDLPVHQYIYETISSKPEYEKYFNQCANELKMAKGKKLKNCWVTFLNLLLDGKKRLKNYAGNAALIKDYKKTNCLKKFPVYGSEIKKNMIQAENTRRLFDQSSIILSDIFPIFNPNHLIIKDVLDCLTLKDYVRFVLEA